MYQLAVVDDKDIPIGSANYDLVHSQGLYHRFVSVFVLDESDCLLIQRRSINKPHANKLSESVSAHVLFGEQYMQAAKRKLKVEIGLENNLREICNLLVKTEEKNWKNNAFVNIYECRTKENIMINPFEIKDLYFFTLDRVSRYLHESPILFVPGFKFVFNAYLKNRDR